MNLQARALAALDPAAAAIHARAGGPLDAADAWLAAHGGEWEPKSAAGKQLRRAARRAKGQSTFRQAWSGWTDQDASNDPFELMAAAQAAAALDSAALAAAGLAADWESLDTRRHASACRITRRRAQQLRAWHLVALQVQGVLL